MAAESEAVGTAQVSGSAGLNMASPNAGAKNSPSSNSQIANAGSVRSFGHIRLDISNSVLPLDKLSPTPSGKDGLSEEVEMQIRSLGCEVIQLSGKLLRLPQVSVFFVRKKLNSLALKLTFNIFLEYFFKSLKRHGYLCLLCEFVHPLEENP